jgi:hypothetical protein
MVSCHRPPEGLHSRSPLYDNAKSMTGKTVAVTRALFNDAIHGLHTHIRKIADSFSLFSCSLAIP